MVVPSDWSALFAVQITDSLSALIDAVPRAGVETDATTAPAPLGLMMATGRVAFGVESVTDADTFDTVSSCAALKPVVWSRVACWSMC